MKLAACEECVRLRKAYWAAIAECGRLEKSLGSAQLPAPNLAAALEAADQARIASLDALLIHRTRQVHT